MLKSNESACDTAISQFIHAGDNPLILGECPLFKAVIASVRLTINHYEPQKRNIVGGNLLENNFEHVKVKNDTNFQKYLFTHVMTAMVNGENC